MKLLNRLREMREEHTEEEYAPDEHSFYAFEEVDETDDYHLDTIGVGTTTVDDIIRLNVEHRNLQVSIFHTSVN